MPFSTRWRGLACSETRVDMLQQLKSQPQIRPSIQQHYNCKWPQDRSPPSIFEKHKRRAILLLVMNEISYPSPRSSILLSNLHAPNPFFEIFEHPQIFPEAMSVICLH